MDPFLQDAQQLCSSLNAIVADYPGEMRDVEDLIKKSSVLSLCARLENVLRVLDGQDVSTPFHGRMNHREMSLALTKLDEVRLWAGEHLRIRAMVDAETARANEFNEAVLRTVAQEPVPTSGPLANGEGSYEIVNTEPAFGPTAPSETVDPEAEDEPYWTQQRINELVKVGEEDTGDEAATPPPGYKWSVEYSHANRCKFRYLVKAG